jgi:hypothetical protein
MAKYSFIEDLSLRTKTRLEVADEYNITAKTLTRWLRRAAIRLPGGLIKPVNLLIIYKTFGIPQKLKNSFSSDFVRLFSILSGFFWYPINLFAEIV